MPKVINDEMIEIPEEMKKVMRRIGYDECSRLLAKTESYVRSLCSKGYKRIRRSDLDIIEHARNR